MNDRLQQGIAAFQAGDRERARLIFEEIVRFEPENDTAWYYLAAAQTDFTLRRQYLERVLQINPQHQRAREVLERMTASASTGTVADPQSGASSSRSDSSRSESGAVPGAVSAGGFRLPVSIPGAPALVGIAEGFRDGLSLMMVGVAVLQGRSGEYDGEAARATWWRFWLLVTVGAAVSTVLNFIMSLLMQFRLSALGVQFNLIGLIIGLLLGIPTTWAVMFAGTAVSHWWTARQGSRVPLYQHAYATALPYIPAQIIGSAALLLLSLIGLGGIGSLISLGVSIYALYVIYQAYQRLHRFADSSSSIIAIVLFFVGAIGAGIVVGLITGLLGAPSVLSIGPLMR
jgi:tetratricopeptide (TPR) repeat protein